MINVSVTNKYNIGDHVYYLSRGNDEMYIAYSKIKAITEVEGRIYYMMLDEEETRYVDKDLDNLKETLMNYFHKVLGRDEKEILEDYKSFSNNLIEDFSNFVNERYEDYEDEDDFDLGGDDE